MPTFATDRLLLRPVDLNDAPFLLKLLNSPGWLQYIGDREVRDVASAENYISERILPAAKGDIIGNFCCINKETNEVMGTCGIYQRDYLDHPDLGYAFLPQFAGHGYAREAASALLANYRVKRPGKKLAAFTTTDNERSINLLEKLGFQHIGPFQIPDDSEELTMFEII